MIYAPFLLNIFHSSVYYLTGMFSSTAAPWSVLGQDVNITFYSSEAKIVAKHTPLMLSAQKR